MKKKVQRSVEAQLQEIRSKFETSKKSFNPEAIAVVDLLFGVIEVLLFAFGFQKNSRNSHKPPSQDPFRERKKKVKKTEKVDEDMKERH